MNATAKSRVSLHPRQNRVDPFGNIIAVPARGTLMGNRGCLHDDQGRIRRPFRLQRWIFCLLAFKGRRRRVMAPGKYTELFFLDEATALAAGHRPCAECQRERFNLFRQFWADANRELCGNSTPSAQALDAALHRERITDTGTKVTYPAHISDLPNGVMLSLPDSPQPYLLWRHQLLAWEPAGYGERRSADEHSLVSVLTPRSVVRALALGYPVGIHQGEG
jgi:hypothetical protein